MKNIIYIICFALIISLHASCGKESLSVSNSNGSSTGGSLARFTLVGNYLYTISYQNLRSYDINDPKNPILISEISVGPDIETIFPFKGYLFIGSSQAMYLYDISFPGKPKPTSQVSYLVFTGRDPVVANDTVAFSTVRSFNDQGGVMNVINIRQITNPSIIGTFIMEQPYGLGMQGEVLYVCEGDKGLKLFNVNALQGNGNTALIKAIQTGDTFYDVIPTQQTLYAYIKEGFMTYNIADAKNPVQLARITH